MLQNVCNYFSFVLMESNLTTYLVHDYNKVELTFTTKRMHVKNRVTVWTLNLII